MIIMLVLFLPWSSMLRKNMSTVPEKARWLEPEAGAVGFQHAATAGCGTRKSVLPKLHRRLTCIKGTAMRPVLVGFHVTVSKFTCVGNSVDSL
jgi:hypothetical protein